MSNSMEDIRILRDKTGAGVVDCKVALSDAGGNIDKAIEVLRKKGIRVAEKKSSRTVKEGIIDCYIHTGAKLGVIIELSCETDFVAKNEEFKGLAHDIAMQIAAKNPKYISRDEVPGEIVEKEKDILKAQFKGKPANVLDKIATGKLEDFYKESCLMDQSFVKDDSVMIKDLITDKVAKFGENIVVKRFARFSAGE
ncbi:MAG: translation elongation factor Ts [Candidatus Omnitrophica bacterium]|nr:translation elongation factor Ts [Candidatus Omnitrophota bacterium]